MKVDGGAIACAVGIELVLAGLAVFGGPHGALGAWPWVLQMPGILVVFAIDGESWFFWRVGAAILLQTVLWYLLIAFVRRRRRAT